MKILQVCLRVPHPPSDGGAIAMFNLAESLTASGHTVKMLCVNTAKHFVDLRSLPADVMAKYQTESVFIDTRVKAFDAFLNLFQTSSYNVTRFCSEAFANRLKELIEKEKYDAVIMESLFMAPYLPVIREKSAAPVFLRSHNVEFQIWDRLAASCKNPLKRRYLHLLATRLKKYELSVMNAFDGILAITDQDKALYAELGCRIPVLTIPVSLDVDAYPDQTAVATEASCKRVFHLGSMDWLPNQEAVKWFMKHVYFEIRNIPGIEVHLAGKAMSDELMSHRGGPLHVYGRVDDARGFMRDKQLMVVPLLSGGGMRVKIIEGLALGKTVISTSVGAEGISCTDGVNIMIADTPEAFINCIKKCAEDPDLALKIGSNARNLAREKYDNVSVGRALTGFIQSKLK